MNKIYFLKVNPHADKEILKCAINLLNLKEPKGQNSKAFANFYSSCLARLVALLFGAEFTSKKATQLKLSKTENGKPYFENASELKFNISHSKDMIAVAFSNNEIGIDIEKLRKCNTKIANRYFAKAEIDYINCSVFNKNKRFFEIWTKKEAFLKKSGTGITVPLNSFDVTSEEISKDIKTFIRKDFIVSVCSNATSLDIEELSETEILQKLKTEALIN